MWYAAAVGFSLATLVAWIIGLVDIYRQRDKMSTGQLVAWVAAIIVFTFFGLIAWLMYRLSKTEAMLEATDLPVYVDDGRDG